MDNQDKDKNDMTYHRESLYVTLDRYYGNQKVEYYSDILLFNSWELSEEVYGDGRYKNIICGYFVTTDHMVFISTHGNQDGSIQHYDEILDLLTDPFLDGFEFYIHCCYPRLIKQHNPELPILSPNHDDITRISAPLDLTDNTCEWFITSLG